MVDPDPEVPEMATGEEEEILMQKNSKESGFDETDLEGGFKEVESEEEEM